MNWDFSLYRESLGKYLFEGRPQVWFNANLGLTERALLEVHEHDHWERANATVYGNEQLGLAETARVMAGQPMADELRRCLQVTVDFSRLVYEGAALESERSWLSLAGLAARPDWFSLMGSDLYKDAHGLFDAWIRKLPYSPGVLASIAANVSDLCLDSVSVLDATKSDREPITARDPMSLRAEHVRALLAKRSPDSLLRSLSEALTARTDVFVRRLDAKTHEILREAGLAESALRADGALVGIGAITRGSLTYAIYEALRLFAEESGAISGTKEHGTLQSLVDYRLVDWMEKVFTGILSRPPNFGEPGVPIGSPSEDQARRDQEFFSTVYTVVGPPERDPATDLPIASWKPVHEAFRALDPEQRKLYLAVAARPAAPPGTSASEASYRLSAARAVISPHNGFAWKFGRARYILETPSSGLREALEEVLPYNPAIAVPFDLMDFQAEGIRGAGPLPDNATLGILLDNVPLERLAQEIRQLARSFRMMSHFYEIGPAEVPFIVTFGIVETARWFLYMPLSLSTRRIINSGRAGITDIPGHEPAWTIDAVPMTHRFRAASVLICEQYVMNGM